MCSSDLLRQPVYLGNDSGQSYAHVWALSRAIFAGDGIPLRLPQLESGQAYMFPYAALPWLPAALLRPLLGDWAVTASMGAGVALLLVGVWCWLPRTASPLLAEGRLYCFSEEGRTVVIAASREFKRTCQPRCPALM
mgnify:CR=1 FL=1